MVVKVKEKFEETINVENTPNLKDAFYVEKKMSDIKKEFYLIKRTLIISTIDTEFINFGENDNRHNVEFFNAH